MGSVEDTLRRNIKVAKLTEEAAALGTKPETLASLPEEEQVKLVVLRMTKLIGECSARLRALDYPAAVGEFKGEVIPVEEETTTTSVSPILRKEVEKKSSVITERASWCLVGLKSEWMWFVPETGSFATSEDADGEDADEIHVDALAIKYSLKKLYKILLALVAFNAALNASVA